MGTYRLASWLLAVVLVLVSFQSLAQTRVVNVYNWAEYTAPDTLSGFERETGIRVRYDVYDSNNTLQAKLLTGKSGYDIVVPSSSYAARQLGAGLFQKLDKSKIPNWKHLDPEIMKLLEPIDPGNQYLVPWGYGTNGLGYNVTKVREILGDDAPLNSWDMLFNPHYASQLKSCGIAMLDEAVQVFPAALHYLGLEPNSTRPEDYEAALELLRQIRPYIRQFSSSGYIDELASGDLCMVYGYSGDILIASNRAHEAGKSFKVDYYLPDGGAPVWFDIMAIPASAAHVDEAHAFINYIETPQVHAAITNTMYYPNANKTARQYVEPKVANNSMIYPSAQVAAQLFIIKALPLHVLRLQNRMWAKLRSGR